MDKFLVRSSSIPNISSKRQADDPSSAARTAKRLAFARSVDKGRPSSIFHKNSFEPLQTDVETDSDVESIERPSMAQKTGHIPPIVLSIDKDWTHQKIKDVISTYTKSFHLKYRGKGKLAVICHSSTAHQALKEGLLKENVNFLTYSRKDEKTPKLVIRGIPSTVCEDLPAELASMGFKDSKVSVMKTKSPVDCPPLLVKLAPGSDAKKFRQIKFILDCVVSIVRYRPNRTLGTQCFRCQAFGHSSKNCNMPPRCIKCTNQHAVGECPKKTRNEPAKCVNCNENHPANYRECSARLAYLQRIRDLRDQQRKPRQPFMATQANKSWADILNTHKNVPMPNLVKSPQIKPLMQETIPEPNYDDKINPPEQHTSACHDTATKEIMDILSTIRKIKCQFVNCNSMLDKVMLVLTHLGHCV